MSDHPPTPEAYGVGARISLQPMTDRFVDVILGALDEVSALPEYGRLSVETGDVSTFVGGDELDVLVWCCALVSAAAGRADGAHVAASLLLSRGCPGEVTCSLPQGRPWSAHNAVRLEPAGVPAVAEWSLYPLDDTSSRTHMEAIESAIGRARSSGLYAGSPHYATRLAGDVADIVSLVGTCWLQVGTSVQHVASHLQFSINSPTTR